MDAGSVGGPGASSARHDRLAAAFASPRYATMSDPGSLLFSKAIDAIAEVVCSVVRGLIGRVDGLFGGICGLLRLLVRDLGPAPLGVFETKLAVLFLDPADRARGLTVAYVALTADRGAVD